MELKDDKYYQIVLMLIYNGLRISEFLDLKKVDVHLEEQYFDVVDSKTENGIRMVPIADKVLPFYQSWFDSAPDCEYLLHSEDNTLVFPYLQKQELTRRLLKRLLDIREPCP